MAYQNFYATKLQTQIDAAATTITVQTPPTVTSGRLVLEPRNAAKREIISFTGVSGNNLTGVVRGLAPTSATTHSQGSLIEMNFLAQDYTDLTDAFNSFAATNNDWRTLVPAVTSVVNNGQRSYDVTFVSSVASLLSPGMRMQFTRSVAAPTQSANLNGTNQYFSKTAPAGMTFTDDFTVMAWVKLTSYPSTNAVVLSRTPVGQANGFDLLVTNTGQVQATARNGAGNARFPMSYQSLPLNKWVHIAATVDMSSYTSATNKIYIDGVDVPASLGTSGTNPTALVQSGDYVVGAITGGTLLFPGKVVQDGVFSSLLSGGTIRSYMSQGLVGTETSLITAHSLSNSLTDLNSTNANNLTANGSATTTNADSPFGGQADGSISATLDYGIIQKVNGSVVTVQVPEGCTIRTNASGISAVKYSGVKSPYGFPGEEDKWTISSLYIQQLQQASPLANTPYNIGGAGLLVPIGKHMVTYNGALFIDNTNTLGSSNVSYTAASNNPISSRLTSMSFCDTSKSVAKHGGTDVINVSSATNIYVNIAFSANSLNAFWYSANVNTGLPKGGLYVDAKIAYL